jgi:nitrate/TMAO reductase-like tetraheme cytochrome c subunit
MFKRLGMALNLFFFPPTGSPRWAFILPYAVLAVLALTVLVGGAYGWEYTNSPQFCGPTCHTMPPQDITYKISPHANVYCTECHIGRAFVGEQFARKSEDIRELYAMIFKTYEFPIVASRSKPARDTCEKCHMPETFSDDSLRVITHFQDDEANTATSIYLLLKTGGGAERNGQGRGIHWHIVNQVEYFATDAQAQNIPYVRVKNADGSYTEYVDVEAGFNTQTLDENQLKAIECTTCHNRVTHEFLSPAAAMDDAMARGLISASIPNIHKLGVEVLGREYASAAEAKTAIAELQTYYISNMPEFFEANRDAVANAVGAIQDIYAGNFFVDQEVNWQTHPNNLGHVQAPGCFRCHDGKHLDVNQQAIRLECNICHAIPIVAGEQDFLTTIQISRGPEPESHRNPNWISLHNQIFDQTCAACHSVEDAGQTTNTSFCSNSACHGSAYTYAGFDAPKLREILQAQIPTPVPQPTPAPATGDPTFAANLAPLFEQCAACHNTSTLAGGLDVNTYAALLKGGKSGAALVAGDSANSLIVKVQSGKHFANFAPADLELLKQWIDAGAQP